MRLMANLSQTVLPCTSEFSLKPDSLPSATCVDFGHNKVKFYLLAARVVAEARVDVPGKLAI